MPQSKDDERLQHRNDQLLVREGDYLAPRVRTAVESKEPPSPFEKESLSALWQQALASDKEYPQLIDTIKGGGCNWPTKLCTKYKVQVSECAIDARERLLFQN